MAGGSILEGRLSLRNIVTNVVDIRPGNVELIYLKTSAGTNPDRGAVSLFYHNF